MKHLFTLCVLLLYITKSATSQECGDRYKEPIFEHVAVTEAVQYGSAKQILDLAGPQYTPVIGTQKLYFDLYQPVGDAIKKRPLIIMAFGGAFVFGTRSDAYMVELCTRYAQLGYVVASIDYRLTREIIALAPTQQFIEKAPEAVMKGTHDMKAAVRFFRASTKTGNPYRIDEEQIYVGGLSAGAFCATHTAYLDKESELPEELLAYAAENGGIEGNSGTPGESSKVAGVISLSGALGEATWLEPNDVPIVSTHGTADEVVPYGSDSVTILGINYPVDGSSIIHKRAKEVKVTEAFYTYHGASHAPESGSDAYLDTGFVFSKNFMYERVCEHYTESTTSVTDWTANHSLSIAPNPTKDLLNFENLDKNSKILIHDALGRKMHFEQISNHTISIKNLPKGSYHLSIYGENEVIQRQILKE